MAGGAAVARLARKGPGSPDMSAISGIIAPARPT